MKNANPLYVTMGELSMFMKVPGILKISSFLIVFMMTGAASVVFAQTTISGAAGNYPTAGSIDADGNIYAAQYDSGNDHYDVVKYTAASSYSSSSVIYNGLYYNGENPTDIEVASNGDVYVLDGIDEPTSTGAILLLDASNSYSSSTVSLLGSYPTALGIDANDDIYVAEYDGTSDYQVVKYDVSAGYSSTVLYNGLGLTGRYPRGLTVDPDGNVYALTEFNVDGANGKIIKLTAPGYASSTLDQGDYYTGLAANGNGDVFATAYNAGSDNYQIVQYTGGSGSPSSVVTGLTYNGSSYPVGLGSNLALGDLVIPDPWGGTNGRLLYLDQSDPVTFDSNGNLVAGVGVSEPVSLPTTATSSAGAVNVFDFNISDGGGDGFPLNITSIDINVTGTSTDTDRGKVTWRLNGPDASNVIGSYDGGTNKITFSGLSISIPESGSETYTINAYYNNNTGLSEDRTFILTVDGDTDLTLVNDGSKTQMGATSAVTNGSGSTIDITATQLAFTTQPAGSTSGSSLTTQPVVTAQDAAGNTDVDFTETITLTEASAGSLTNNTQAASSGVATFSGLTYTATADQQSFTLTANDQDGVGSNLPTVDANSVTSDVIATKLVFSTQPAPTSFQADGSSTSFTTVPVVQAVDANDIVDTGYSTGFVLAEVNGAGSATLTGTGDVDGSASTVTLVPSSGAATFTNLAITYSLNDVNTDENFNLQAASGALTTVNSTQLTALGNAAPTFANLSGVVETTNEDTEAEITFAEITAQGDETDSDGTVDAFIVKTVSSGTLKIGADAGTATAFNATTNNTIDGSNNAYWSPASNANGTLNAFTITAQDNQGGESSPAVQAQVSVTAINDDPAISSLPTSVTVTEDVASNVDLSAATFSDPDAGANSVTLTLTAGAGTLTASSGGGVTTGGSGTGTLTLTGTASNINAYLNTASNIQFTTAADGNGTPYTSVTLTANDGGNTGSGGGTDVSLGSYNVNATAINDTPLFTGLDAVPSYTEGGTAVILDGDVTVSDEELDALNGAGGDYAGATLTITRNGGANANDRLSVVSGGNLTVAGGPDGGGTVTAGGNVIATIANTGNGQLQLAFANNGTIPTTALVTETLQATRYTNASNDPAESVQLDWSFSDGNSGSQGSGATPGTTTGSVTVSVTNVNDAPTLSATGLDPTYVEGATAADLYSGPAANTVETTNTADRFSDLTLTVSNVSDGASEILRIDGTDVALTNGNAVTTAMNSLTVNVSVTGSTATVSFSGESLTNAQIQTLVDAMGYRNTSDNPTTAGNRMVTITGISDDGGTLNGGSDSATPNLTSTVSLTSVNDPPVVGNLSGDNTGLQAGGAAAGIDNGGDATLSNVDSPNYNGGFLAITDNGANNTASGNFSVDGTNVTSAGDAAIAAGETIFVGGTSIGTVSSAPNDGQGGNSLTIALGAGADNARVQTLTRNLRWSAAAGSGAQTFTLTLNDGDGVANSGDADAAVNFTMTLGNPPVIANLDGDAVDFLVGGPPVTLDALAGAGLTDSDNPASLNGGNLTATVSSGAAAAEDILTLDTSGSVTLSGTTAGSNVSVSGDVVGTLANNIAAGNDLRVNLNSNATLARVASVLQAIQYSSNASPLTEASRQVSVTVTDNDGLASDAATITVTTVANQAPTLAATGSDPSYLEGGGGTGLFSGASASTVEAGQSLTGLTLTVSNQADGEDEILRVDGTDVALTDGNSVTTAINNLTAAVSVSSTTATVSISGGSLTPAALQTLVDGLTYRNTSDDPGTTDRVVTIASLSDDGGTANGGDDTASLSIGSTISITPVNDAPTLSATGTDPTYTDGDAAAALFTGANASTVEAVQSFTQLTFLVANLADGDDEKLMIDGTELALTDGTTATTAGNNLNVSVSVTSNTATVTVSAAGIPPATMNTVIEGLAYRNSSYTPSTGTARTVMLTGLTDDGGTDNGGDDSHSDAVSSVVMVADLVRPAPELASSSPSDGATGVALNAPITATFDREVSVADLSGVTITDGTTSVSGVSASLTSVTELSITHNALASDETYEVTIPAGAVQNVDGVTNGPLSWSFTIQKAELIVGGSFTAQSRIYNGGDIATIDADNLTLDGVHPDHTVEIDFVDATFEDEHVGTGKQVSIHTLALSGADSDNYTVSLAGAPTTTADITPRPITVTADPYSAVYGEADPAFTYQLTSGSLPTGDSITGEPDRDPGTDTGTYGITQGDVTAGSNFDLTFVPADFTITPKTLVVQADADQSKIYGEADPTLIYNATGFEYSDDESVFTGTLERAAGDTTGTYAINQGSLDAGSNYTIDYTGADFIITPKTLAVQADTDQSKIYGETDPGLTYSATGFEYSDDESIFTGSLERATGEATGTYAINQGSLDAGPNYSIDFTGADFTIIGKTLVVDVDDNISKVYGENDPDFTYFATGFDTGDDSSILTGSLARKSGEDVGTYAITLGDLDAGDNYEITLNSDSLYITPKTLTVTAEAGQTKVYGEADPEFSYTASGFVFSDDESLFSGSLSRAEGEDTGSYEIKSGNLSAGANYTIDFMSEDFTVTPAMLTVEAEAGQTKFEGEEDPEFSYIASGFVRDDEASVVTGSLTREPGEAPGTYALQIGSLEAPNYEITFTASDFTILRTPPVAEQFQPAVNAGMVANDANIFVRFDQSIELDGTGQVRLLTQSGEVDGIQIYTREDTLVINPETPLEHFTHYKVIVDAETVQNLDDIPNAESSWEFITIMATPTITFPGDAAVDISTAPRLEWNVAAEKTNTRIQFGKSQDLSDPIIDSKVARTGYQLNNLEANQNYYWRVRTLDTLQGLPTASVWSGVHQFTTRLDPEEEESGPVTVTVDFGGTSGSTDGNGEAKKTDPAQTDYRMVGMPGTDNVRLENFFEGPYKKKWRAFIETGDDQEFYDEYEEDDNRFIFRPGLGFWVLSTEVVTADMEFSSVETNAEDSYGFPVHSGWNIISNPFQSPVEWTMVEAFNEIESPLYGYNEKFIEADTLYPFQGYYYYNDPAWNQDTLFIPYTGFEQRTAEEQVAKDLSPLKDAGTLSLKAIFPDSTTATIEMLFGPKQKLSSFRQPYPNLQFARTGAVLAEEDETRLRYQRTLSSNRPEDEQYLLEVKAPVGSSNSWTLDVQELPEHTGALLVNKVTNETFLLQAEESQRIKHTEPLSRYDVYTGDLTYLQEVQEKLLPQSFELSQNYPNPFNPATNIRYALPARTEVRLEIFDILGRKVQTLVNERQPAGWHIARWDASGLASGMYLYRLTAGKEVSVKKLTLIK